MSGSNHSSQQNTNKTQLPQLSRTADRSSNNYLQKHSSNHQGSSIDHQKWNASRFSDNPSTFQ